MKVLLTGGNGFIGRYLKAHLPYNVVTPSSSELNLLDLDAVTEYLKHHKFDAVINAAVKGREFVKSHDMSICDANLWMFHSLANNREYFKTLINFGSGAEFGLDRTIVNATEDDILKRIPDESYGHSKNIIARAIKNIPNFYNLRIFACCDPSEDDTRLIKKFKNTVEKGQAFVLDKDRYIDFFTLADINTVVSAILDGCIKEYDLNLVYQDKLKASDILAKYCSINNVDPALLQVTGQDVNDYTGNGERLANTGLVLEGLDATLARYKG